MEELASEKTSRFRPPKTGKEEVSLPARSTPEGTKTSRPLMVFKIGKQRERKKMLYSSRKACSKSMYDVHRGQSLLEDMDSLSLNYWLTKLAQ